MGECCSAESAPTMLGNIDCFVVKPGPPKFEQNVLVWHGRGKLANNIVFYPDLEDKASG